MPDLIDSYSEDNLDTNAALNATYLAVSQDFTTTATIHKISSAKFYLIPSGGPTGNVYAKLLDTSNAVLATSDAVSAATISSGLVEFTFSGAEQYSMTQSTNYRIAVYWTYTGGNIFPYGDGSSPSHSGNARYTKDGSTWANGFSDTQTGTGYDLIFYVYGVVAATGGNIQLLNYYH